MIILVFSIAFSLSKHCRDTDASAVYANDNTRKRKSQACITYMAHREPSPVSVLLFKCIINIFVSILISKITHTRFLLLYCLKMAVNSGFSVSLLYHTFVNKSRREPCISFELLLSSFVFLAKYSAPAECEIIFLRKL